LNDKKRKLWPLNGRVKMPLKAADLLASWEIIVSTLF